MEKKKLRYVKAMFRHGERAPKQKPYPKDKYDESFWPRGWGELVELGERQLGEFFSHRYGNFITQPEELFVQAAPVTRTIESAKLFLDGFFPINEENNERISHPVYINASDQKFDCPAYEKLVDPIMQMEEKKYAEKYEKFLKFLARFVNDDENLGKIPTWNDFAVIAQVNREIAMNLPQPWWMNKVWEEFDGMRTFEVIADIIHQNRLAKYSTPQLARLKGGIVLGEFLNDASRVARNEPMVVKLADGTQLRTIPKMIISAVRSPPLSELLYAMNANEKDEFIPTAACFIMEIFEGSDENLFVEVHFGTAKKMKRLELEDCGEFCVLSKFLEIYTKKAILNEKSLYEECGREFAPSNSQTFEAKKYVKNHL